MGAHAVGCKSTSLRPSYVTMHDSQKSTLQVEEINFIWLEPARPAYII